MKPYGHLLMATLFLAGCEAKLGVITKALPSQEALSIITTQMASRADVLLVEWDHDLGPSAEFTLALASDDACLNAVVSRSQVGVTALELTLTDVAEGDYRICLTAKVDGKIISAVNDGVKFTIDRTAPVVEDLPHLVKNHAITVSPNVADVTEVSYQWEIVSGPTGASLSSATRGTSTVSFTTDGDYGLRLTATDAAGNATVKEFALTYDATPPVFTSLVRINEASDGYVNDAEKAATGPLWQLDGSSYDTYATTAPVAVATVCDAAQNYANVEAIPSPASMTSDGSWVVCVKLTDTAGNVTFGKSETVLRDVAAPLPGDSGFIATQSTGNHSTVLTWTKATDALSAATTLRYRVFYSTSVTLDTVSATEAGTAGNSYTTDLATLAVTELSPAATYYFNVVVQDEAGNKAVYSKIREVTTNDLFMQISMGTGAACGLTVEGKIYCWGTDVNGRLGNGSAGTHQTPMLIDSNDRFLLVSVGEKHACALRADRRVLCWGHAADGRLGNGDTTTDQQSPVLVSTTDTFRTVSAGARHSCGLRTDGLVFCWGDDSQGELGNDVTLASQSTPVQVTGISNAKDVYTTVFGTCALLASGDAYCWGVNTYGGLGNGTTTSPQPTPTAVTGGLKFKKLTANPVSYHTCGLTAAGEAYCWGLDGNAQLGNDAATTDQTSPALVSGGYVFRDIASGLATTCGITDAGTALCWGSQQDGALGDGVITATNQHLPQAVQGGLKWRSVLPGEGRACGIAGNGKLYCWGSATGYMLGNGGLTNQTAPTLADLSHLRGDNDFVKIAPGINYTCGLKASGDVYCWGDDATGKLGDDMTVADQSSPVKVALSEAVIDLGMGYAVGCAVGVSGNLYCWGSDAFDGIGLATAGDALIPVLVGATSDRWIMNSSGSSTLCALKSNGKPFCWGRNDFGQSGTGVTGGNVTTPTAVSVGADVFTQINSGEGFHCGLTDGGAGRCWGIGNSGQLGDGSYANRNTPVTVSNISDLIMIQPGGAHTCALLASGKMYCWGRDTEEALGNGPGATGVNLPAAIDAANSYVSVMGAYHSNCGIRTTGYLYCWGEGSGGALGDGSTTMRDVPTLVALSHRTMHVWGKGRTTFARADNGLLYGCGTGTDDQLADGPIAEVVPTPRVMGPQLTGLTATASQNSSTAASAVDGVTTSFWTAGVAPPEYIEVDLKKTSRVKRVRLRPAMSSASGATVHEFYNGVKAGAAVAAGTYSGTNTHDTPFEFEFNPPLTDTRFLRIRTTTSPGDVGWFEVEVYE